MDPLDPVTILTPVKLQVGNLKEGSHTRGVIWMILLHLQVQWITRLNLQESLPASQRAKGKDTNKDARQIRMNSTDHINLFRGHHQSTLPNRRENCHICQLTSSYTRFWISYTSQSRGRYKSESEQGHKFGPRVIQGLRQILPMTVSEELGAHVEL